MKRLSKSGAAVIVRVPASTSNLGPGFDTLGLALRLYNMARVSKNGEAAIRLVSPIADDARAGATAMLAEAAEAFFARVKRKSFGADVALGGDVPIARGLGSSVTARLGVVAGLNELARTKLSRQDLLELVSGLEHHPDNAAPAIFGGFTVAGLLGTAERCLHFPVSPRLKLVTLIPRFEVSTEAARKLVPANFSKSDTVHNLNRAALISAAFASRNYDALRGLFDDRVHQPYRMKLIPQLSRVIAAGEKAGAIGGWLSGSGSTIICLTLRRPDEVGRAMRRELPDSDLRILTADARGLVVSGRG